MPPAAPEPGPWWKSTRVTVDEVGYHDGFYLEDTEGARDLYLPMPAGVTPIRADLVLDLRFGETLIGESTIRVSIDDSVRRAVRRADAGAAGTMMLNLALNERDMARTFVKVHFDYTQLMDRDVCFSRNVTGAYTRIGPESGLAILAGDNPPATVHAAWSLLPRKVVVSADLAHTTPGEMQSLLQLATLLHRDGHDYTFEHIDASAGLDSVHGQIVFVTAERLRRWGVSGTRGDQPGANVRLVTAAARAGSTLRRAFVAIDQARPLPAVDLLRMPWRRAASGHVIDVAAAGEWPPAPDHPDRVRLRDLGFIDAERRFSSITQWTFDLPFGPMGDGMRPDQVQLAVFAPSAREEHTPAIVSAYFNERLVYSAALKGDGEAQTLSFVLPAQLLRARNRLNLVAQREEVASNCRVTVAAQPISLSPNSPVLLKPATTTPKSFAELVPYQRSLHVYLSTDTLAAAAEIVPFLVAVGEHFWPDVPPPPLRFFDPGAPLNPEDQFLVIGNPRWSPEAPVEFSNGRVRITNAATHERIVELDLSSDADGSVLQMVRTGGLSGAWLRTAAGYGALPTHGLQFEDENVALLDRQGVQMALRVGAEAKYTVDYPEAMSWFDTHRQARIVLFALGWLIAAIAGVALIRRGRRAGDRHDS